MIESCQGGSRRALCYDPPVSSFHMCITGKHVYSFAVAEAHISCAARSYCINRRILTDQSADFFYVWMVKKATVFIDDV